MTIMREIQKSELYRAIQKSKYRNKMNYWKLISGRLGFDRFTKIQNFLLESLYTMSGNDNPSSYRLFLYLIRNYTGWNFERKVRYVPKKLKKELNMGTSFYNAKRTLLERNMISIEEINDEKFVLINTFPDTWVTDDNAKISDIIRKEIEVIIGKKHCSSMSNSSFSYSSSSLGFIGNEDSDEKLLLELEELDSNSSSSKSSSSSMIDKETLELLEELDELDNI